MLKSYVKAGADIDGITNSKETALHKCGRWDRKEAAIYLLSLGANPLLKNGDGNKASDMTADPEMKFILDNFDEYLISEEKRKREKKEKKSKGNNNNSLGLFQVSNRLYDSSLNAHLTINMNEILKSSPRSPTTSPTSVASVASYSNRK
jgi:hypothetical protein